jgi:hypothetical protein
MRNLLLIVMVLGLTGLSRAQDNPVKWVYSAQKLDEKTYEVHMTASIAEGWHIYAQQQPKDAISLPTKIKFNKNPLVRMEGSPAEIGKKEKYSIEALGITQYQYADKVDFVQRVELKAPGAKISLSGSIAFQACTDEMCLPAAEMLFKVTL